MSAPKDDLKKALRAVLLFHAVGPWTPERSVEWFNLTGKTEATTKVLCDTVRAAISKAEG